MDIGALISKAAITFWSALPPLAAPVGTKDRFLKTRVWQDLLWVLTEKKRARGWSYLHRHEFGVILDMFRD